MKLLVWPFLCVVTLFGLVGLLLWTILPSNYLAQLRLNREVDRPSAQVLGNSMAPTLWGSHYEVACPYCGALNRYASESYPAAIYHCQNCKRELAAGIDVLRTGAKVTLYPQEKPNRWDMVLVREPDEAERVVKRLIAFPGERIRIQHGDIWIGEQRIPRTFDDLMSCRVLVHTDRFDGTTPLVEGMPSTGWKAMASDSNKVEGASEHWVYRHAEPWRSAEATRRASILAGERERPESMQVPDSRELVVDGIAVTGEVTDWYPCDPAYAGPLWNVDDLFLDLMFQVDGPGELNISYRQASDAKFCSCDAWRLQWDEHALYWNQRRIECPSDSTKSVQIRVIAAYCDGAYWMKLYFMQRANMQRSVQDESPTCLASYAWHQGVDSISNLRQQLLPGEVGRWWLESKGIGKWYSRDVYRDLYFRADDLAELRGDGLERELTGFFLLGDNQPISLDSRQKKSWLLGVPQSWLEGIVRVADQEAP